VTLVAWFLLAGPAPVAVTTEASLLVEDGYSMTLMPDGDDASTWLLKRQGVREITVRLVALSGRQAKTCATIKHSWAKDKPIEDAQIVMVNKRQADGQTVPSLGIGAPGGAGSFDGSVVKVNGKRLRSYRPAVGRALSPKDKHLIAIAFFADKDGEKQFQDWVKDFASFDDALKTLTTLEDVQTWANQNPKVTVTVLTLSWLPAE
jgi:hypothetical protein